jgi:hypothetical protein
MKRALTVAALSVLAAAGCRGSRLEVRTLTTTPSSMTVPLDGAGSAENAIRTEGKDTLVTFRGKTIIVRNLVGYTASITPSDMKVQVGAVSLSIDERELSVSAPDYHMAMTVWKDVGGQRLDLLGGRKVIVSDVPPFVVLEGE